MTDPDNVLSLLSDPGSPLPSMGSPSHPESSHEPPKLNSPQDPRRRRFSSSRRRPPYAYRFPQHHAQVFFHTHGLAVLCLRDHGFTLTNGVVSYASDRVEAHKVFNSLHYLNVGTLCVTDSRSKQDFKDIQAKWSAFSPFKRIPVMLLKSHARGECPFCHQTQCHRWIAVQGMCSILHQPLNPIFHSHPA